MLGLFCFKCCFLLLYNVLCFIVDFIWNMLMWFCCRFRIFWGWNICMLFVLFIGLVVIDWIYLFVFVMWCFGLLVFCVCVFSIMRSIFSFVVCYIFCFLGFDIIRMGRYVWLGCVLLRGVVYMVFCLIIFILVWLFWGIMSSFSLLYFLLIVCFIVNVFMLWGKCCRVWVLDSFVFILFCSFFYVRIMLCFFFLKWFWIWSFISCWIIYFFFWEVMLVECGCCIVLYLVCCFVVFI